VEGIKDEEVAKEKHLRCDPKWLVKLLQLHTIQKITHGAMLVEPSGAGKPAGRYLLLDAIERLDGVKWVAHKIAPKAINEDHLYGVLDPTTIDWTDGVFTQVLSTIINNNNGAPTWHSPLARPGMTCCRHWIMLDGDVDPDWAYNFNSVLDDKIMLTLPNGERLALTPNIRINITLPMLCDNQLSMLRDIPIVPDAHTMRRQTTYESWEDVHGSVV